MTSPLRIGLSACFFHPDPDRNVFKGKTLLYFEESMLHWLQRGGALPFLLPTGAGPFNARSYAEAIDGLVLQGGADMSPRSYGEEPLRPEWAGDARRDAYELELVRACVELGKPVLGVCRGLQVINVAFGGTLWQDIVTMHPKGKVHRDREVYDQLFHDIEITEGSWLHRAYEQTTGTVNSVHHQGIKELGKGLVIEAIDPTDGMIEAIRAKDAPVFAVQWHPEFIDTARTDLLAPSTLFQAFLREIRGKAP